MVIGNCGFGFAPYEATNGDHDRLMLALTRNEAIPYEVMKQGMLWDWVTFPQFLDSIDRIPKGVNVLSYVLLTPLYAWVMGYEKAQSRRPNEAELTKMGELLNEAMDAGACGWSAQVLGPDSLQRDYDGSPMITDLMSDEELLWFARALAARDEGSIELAYQGTGEEARMLEASTMEFVGKMGEAANRPVVFQAIISNDRNPEQHLQRLRWLDECSRRAVPVYGQGAFRRSGFELTFEEWNLFDETPAWREVTLGTVAERKAKMEDPQLRAALRAEWDSGTRPEALVKGSVAGLLVEEVGRRDFEHYIGQDVGQIAESEGKHVIDALLDMMVADNLQTEFLAPAGRDNLELWAEIFNSPSIVAGASDGGAHVKFLSAGIYPTDMLTRLVRDSGLMSLEEAHYKLS